MIIVNYKKLPNKKSISTYDNDHLVTIQAGQEGRAPIFCVPGAGANITDFTPIATALPLVELGRQMHIIGGPDEAPFPLNVGLLFLNPEPRCFFPATQIDVVWFPDGPGGDTFTAKSFQGPLQRIAREALDYIRRNYLNETVIKHPDRAEATRVANFPYEAIEGKWLSATGV